MWTCNLHPEDVKYRLQSDGLRQLALPVLYKSIYNNQWPNPAESLLPWVAQARSNSLKNQYLPLYLPNIA